MKTKNRTGRILLFLRIVAGLALLLLLYVASILVWGTYHDYQPEDRLLLSPVQNAPIEEIGDSVLSFTVWNVGYGGLGEESDFFYDNGHFFFSGGHTIRTPLPLVQKNIAGMEQTTASTASDFFLFQEVDQASRRSYYINEVARLTDQQPSFTSVFASNYQVSFVPIPLLEPWRAYGRTHSGLLSLSRWQPLESVRLQLPGSFPWPTRLFQLDRCVLLQRFALSGGGQLVVLNIHNSAYDADGTIKKQQMEFLQQLLLEEYHQGHYVIAGGDWNQCPPYFRFDGFMPGRSQGYTQINIDDDFLPADWKWVYDPTVPTNRKTRTPYVPGTSFVTIIDFFLISPNVQVRQVKTLHQDFQYSDHQPVWMEVELLGSGEIKQDVDPQSE